MTSPGGGLQDESHSPIPQQAPSLQIPKNRAGGGLNSAKSSSSSLAADAQLARVSTDSHSRDEAYDSLTRSPILSPNTDSGLRRIRQQPPANLRIPTSPNLSATKLPKSPQISPAPSRKSSLIHNTGPLSPSLPHSEDLTRFPSESLHSFSFAHQGSDLLQNRQNVLKRSIEFMRDKLGWAATSPRIASAQARLAGDEELLSMLELLQKASLINPDPLSIQTGLGIGPLTGPAHMASDNIFEKAFLPDEFQAQAQSPRNLETPKTPTIAETEEPEEGLELVRQNLLSPITSLDSHVRTETEPPGLSRITTDDMEIAESSPPPPRPQRASLKRTYTDVAGYSLQHKLTEALAQPYRTNQSPSTMATTNAPIFRPPPPQRSGTTINERAPHGHRNNQAQAIFTTDGHAPWTITAANDLACLVFGVTRAEVRKLGIMEVIAESHRRWLEEKLKNPDAGTTPKQSPSKPVLAGPAGGKTSATNSIASAMGNGITAKLLSKPPVRQSYVSRRSKTEGGAAPSRSTPVNPHHANNKSRGVLLCGDVVPIRKMNGSAGSASLWVKEKGGGLIWVLEEIAEDVAFLEIDEIGLVLRGKGDVHGIWGLERVRNGMDVQRLIPAFPKLKGTNTGAIDYDAVTRLKRFTARTSNSISIPITVEQQAGSSTFRISSFPHIAGIIVLNPTTMKVQSSNSVFSSALFGYDDPDGLPISDLIPLFGEVLRVMTDEDKIALEDGIVIPEHSFRRARSLLALREGKQDAAQFFLRPAGLPARHRDGAEIMVDVQMRVVQSDRSALLKNDSAIAEEPESEFPAGSEIVFALWITYSRQLHAVNHGIGPVTPMMSRPSTPPQQPLPGNQVDTIMPSPLVGGTTREEEDLRSTLLTQQLEEAKALQDSSSPSDAEPYEHPSPDMITAGVKVVSKKRIDDFNILEEMGQGAYGQVKLARYKKPAAQKMVIKYVTKKRILVDTWHRDRRLGTVPLEIHVLDYLRRDGLQHPNIVEMADFFEDDINYYIEMLPHGLPGMDLFDYIELRVTMEESECRMIFKQVAEALAHLHGKAKVVHRDIKDENVILDGEGNVKLVDFGSAAYIKSGPFDVFVGTIDYAAPEVLRGSPYRGKEQDVWALGILLYTIVYKENPFYSIDEIMDHDLRVPYVMSEDCIDLIRKMLDRDVDRRIGIQAVLEHPWSTTIDVVDDEEGNAANSG